MFLDQGRDAFEPHGAGGLDEDAVGERAQAYLDGAPDGVAVADAAAFADVLDVLRPGDVVLVKASRAVGLEGIPALIEKHSQAWHES